MTDEIIRSFRSGGAEKGVLLPLFSLPSEYGIGCISDDARRFIDWLAETGNSYWQVLPLNPTGCGDSPYQPLSSFAGNAYFIDPGRLILQGLLSEEEVCRFDFGTDPGFIDYGCLYDARMEMLHLAFSRFDETAEYAGFCDENSDWLDDYAMFMALREEYGRELSWDKWPEPVRRREPDALERVEDICADEISFYKWTQFEFFREWTELKEYANSAGIKIIGDMPIYVSYDSADCWADPGQFQLDGELMPTLVAGVPPDAFAEEGQLWGNPLYDWEAMSSNGYRWWVSRIRQGFRMYDVIRLDHFRGYEAYYAVPADAENAMNGEWRPGPGMGPFRELEKMGSTESLQGKFIAEDLGFLTEEVHRLLRESGFPGTKVLQFGFDGDPGNIYLPENYPDNCVVYTGTHDNDTTTGWFTSLAEWERAPILRYLGIDSDSSDLAERVCEALIRKALDSRAAICIIPMQDYLCLGSEARINIPGTIGGNWCWRMARESWPDPEG